MDASTTPFLVRHEFLIRRLHSLSGLVPVGAFMCVHLATNASVLGGAEIFQDNVDRIHSLGPLLPLVEWTFIFLPILFHAIIGVLIVRTGLPNSGSYPYRNNIRYTLQRATAWIALVFIFYHVFQMHGWFHFEPWKTNVAERFGGAKFDPHAATSSAAIALQSIAVKIAYAVGVLACVYHLANGIWTAGITWGIWVTPQAQRRADWVCLAFGIALAAVGLGAISGFSSVNVADAQLREEIHRELKEEPQKQLEERLKEQGGQAQAATESR